MGHAGITDFTKIDAITDRDELLYEIYKETVKNLMFEDGIEWSMLLRFPMEVILKVKPAIREKNYIILPIPAAEFEKNPTIGDQIRDIVKSKNSPMLKKSLFFIVVLLLSTTILHAQNNKFTLRGK